MIVATQDVSVIDEAWSILRTIDDPEYPGVSIVDLGLVERVELVEATLEVDLIPTFSGCPALAMIASDVEQALGESVVGSARPGASTDHRFRVVVRWCQTPVWTTERLSAFAREQLAEAFTVAVHIRGSEPSCPRCGGALVEQSMFGPSRCRSVARCTRCGEPIETLRS